MKTVGEFKKAGLVFVEGDACKDQKSITYVAGRWSKYENEGDDDWIDDIITEFEWRENTGVKPEFEGLIEVEDCEGHKDALYPKDIIWNHKHKGRLSCKKWRPSLNQPSVIEHDTKKSAIHKAWVALGGKVKAISDQWKTLWHVKDGYYTNGEYYHSFNDKCEETGAKFICTIKEFTDYCEKMAAEENLMNAIMQNGNDGLHYGKTAQQVEAFFSGGMPKDMKFAPITGVKAKHAVKCSCIGCDNESTHTWNGHPTCDDCGTPSRSEVRKVVNQSLLHPRNPEIISPSLEGFSVGYKASKADDKPIFTQAMADAGELPPVGAKCKYKPDGLGCKALDCTLKAVSGNEYWIELDCDGLIELFGEKLAMERVTSRCSHVTVANGKFLPLDTRTDREKAIDAMAESLDQSGNTIIIGICRGLYDAGYRKC